MVFSAVVCLVGCGPSTDAEMLEGKWNLTRAYETVTLGTAPAVVNDLEGYVGRTMELSEDGLCRRVDRDEVQVCLWYLSTDRRLIFADTLDNHVLEDYAINELTKERLVCSNEYDSYDSLTGTQSRYAYRFEYSKD